jgi:hypothetical protein
MEVDDGSNHSWADLRFARHGDHQSLFSTSSLLVCPLSSLNQSGHTPICLKSQSAVSNLLMIVRIQALRALWPG